MKSAKTSHLITLNMGLGTANIDWSFLSSFDRHQVKTTTKKLVRSHGLVQHCPTLCPWAFFCPTKLLRMPAENFTNHIS
jgi:hypothetical protein